MRLSIFSMISLCAVLTSNAYSAPAKKAAPQGTQASAFEDAFEDDIALDTYLDALARISPDAREGADAYLGAYRRRCGRALKTVELRRAIAEGDGDPVLMAMIRAVAHRDTAALQHLSGTVSCASRR